jgi:hypothetical protein
MARSTCVIRSSRLLARVISCSRSNVLVPVSAWSSPAESVEPLALQLGDLGERLVVLRLQLVAALDSATRIFSVSAALRSASWRPWRSTAWCRLPWPSSLPRPRSARRSAVCGPGGRFGRPVP